MTECGDLREGIFDEEELLNTARTVEQELKNLHLLGDWNKSRVLRLYYAYPRKNDGTDFKG